MKLTNRTLLRAGSILFAAAAAMTVKAALVSAEADSLRLRQTNSYYGAMEDLAAACEGLRTSLERQLYATGDLRRETAVDIYARACEAKAALARLPVTDLRLENTSRFLSQAGNFSLSLGADEPDDEEYKALLSLCEYADGLSERVYEIESSVMSGEISLSPEDLDGEEPPAVTEGIMDFEGSFDSYPKLIYDGPFSDNILEKSPELTKNASEVSEETALIRAAAALDMSTAELTGPEEVGGKLPSMRFSDPEGSAFCQVTRAGGYISYMLKPREVYDEAISREDAVTAAEEFAGSIGLSSMEVTYYEVRDNIMTVNLCYSDRGTRVYPDLAKVTVAMDTGEILGCDCAGYIVNHRERDLGQRGISLGRAKSEVSPRLMIEDQRMAVIPTDGANERECYEFTCRAETGRRVLVYIDAATAECADVLMLVEGDFGTLTE